MYIRAITTKENRVFFFVFFFLAPTIGPAEARKGYPKGGFRTEVRTQLIKFHTQITTKVYANTV